MARARTTAGRGLTLIELTVALAIIAVLLAAVVMSVGAITGAKAKAATGELGGTIRALYDTAALSGKTCRLAFQLPAEKDDSGHVRYWAECASGNLTARRDRDDQLREENRALEDAAKSDRDHRPSDYLSQSSRSPSLQDILAREKQRVAEQSQYGAFTSPEVKPRDLPSSVRISVWTPHQKDPVKSGRAYIYFFPQGFAEKSQVYVRQGGNVWTIQVAPLTGKTRVVGEELEVPRT